MFSYLRSNNRRSAHSPAPNPYLASSRYVHSLQGSTEEFPHNYPSRTNDQPSPSPISPDPPVLPPIPRVASQYESSKQRDGEAQFAYEAIIPADGQSQEKQRTQIFQSSKYEEPRSAGRLPNEQRSASSRIAVMGPPPISLQQNPQSQDRQLQPPPAPSHSIRSYSDPFSKHTKTRTHEQAIDGAQPARAPPPPPLKLPSGPASNGAQARQGKARFNLLNPMALLARRRSHQALAESNIEKAQYKSAYPPVLRIPDDFDPRIRGKVVHDFSAPRPGTNESSSHARGSDKQREAILYNSRRPSPNASTSFADDDSPSSGEREHTPQFKEHFDEDYELVKDGPAKQRTSGFMYQVSLSESQPDPDPSVLPPFARHLPSNISTAPSTVHKACSPPPRRSLEIVPEASVTAAIPANNSLPSTPPSSPPVKGRSRASSSTDPSSQPAGLPKHFKSNASRFSFDLTGVGSAAQEKLLEDKHRQHEKNKVRRSNESQPSEIGTSARDADDDGECSDDYENLDDDDGLEEKIPGVNADADGSTTEDPHQHMHDTEFVSLCKSSFISDPSIASTGVTSSHTPRDSMGIPVNISTTHVSPGSAYPQTFSELRSFPTSVLGSSTSDLEHAHHAHPTDISDSGRNPSASVLRNDGDDLYFDDGMIEGPGVLEDHAFDESVFDDDDSNVYGLPLRDRKFLPEEVGVGGDGQKLHDSFKNMHQDSNVTRGGQHLADEMSAGLKNSFTQLAPTQPDRGTRSSFNQSADLSNNAGYLNALALGINQAALNGKFNRWPSLRPGADSGYDGTTGSSGTCVQGDAGNETEAEALHIDGGMEDTEDIEFDDALADDSIIAAANAEALENDDEGFYGQEFGFFARASGAGEAEYANGGYFGSRGLEGIGRNHSGRNQEPSLTPITERSEWSNRNSAISLAMHGFQQPHSAGPQSSAGLAQLADLIHLEDDDLSLSALLKLRRGAWGGSNASLQSSSSGSPLTYVSGVGFPAAIPVQHSNSSHGNVNFSNGSPLTMYTGQNPTSSSYSLGSSNGFASSPDDSLPSPASPAVTVSAQQPPQSAPAFLPQQQYFVQQSVPILSRPGGNAYHQPQRRSMSPVKRSSMGPPPRLSKGHSRNNSNTSESVSYVLESGGEDGGQGRWVLEKRRTDESGMVEVLGREIVEGGRI
ncbi:MAG: hypothetical protein Q9166_001345 [cf. Caloplaca sp. 2 TL-2023]